MAYLLLLLLLLPAGVVLQEVLCRVVAVHVLLPAATPEIIVHALVVLPIHLVAAVVQVVEEASVAVAAEVAVQAVEVVAVAEAVQVVVAGKFIKK